MLHGRLDDGRRIGLEWVVVQSGDGQTPNCHSLCRTGNQLHVDLEPEAQQPNSWTCLVVVPSQALPLHSKVFNAQNKSNEQTTALVVILVFTMKVELSLYAKNLKNVGGAFGVSDPFCVVTSLATQPGSKAQVLGKTEVIRNELSPNWVRVLIIDYELGTPIKIACSVFDDNKKSANKPMGSAVFEIGELLGARGNTKVCVVHFGAVGVPPSTMRTGCWVAADDDVYCLKLINHLFRSL
jgi:C2 domain